MHRSLQPEAFLESEFGRELVPTTRQYRASLGLALSQISSELPSVAKSVVLFATNSSFVEFSFRIGLLPHDYLEVQVLTVTVSYTLQWANPCWDWLQFDPSAEIQSVKARVKEAVSAEVSGEWVSARVRAEDLDSTLTLHPSWYALASYRVKKWWLGSE